jgi:uncharacterized protein (DUF362 family)
MIQLFQQKTYDREEISSLFRQIFAEGGDARQTLDGKKRILLKPNFVVPEAKGDGATTHPDFYMSLATFLQSEGFVVGIGESPAFGSCRKALQFHGVLEECEAKKIEIVEFKKNEVYEGVTDGGRYSELTIAAEIQDWDAVINLPKLKVHQQFMFTGATKNLYGCVTGKRKFIRHNFCKNDPVKFAKMVLANATKANCVLHIGDGIEAMHVKGPRGGECYPLGKIIVADDFLVHDWLMTHLIDLAPETTPLFQAVSAVTRESLQSECQEILNSAEFSVAENFKQSYAVDVSFSPWHLLRTAWRSFQFNMKNS